MHAWMALLFTIGLGGLAFAQTAPVPDAAAGSVTATARQVPVSTTPAAADASSAPPLEEIGYDPKVKRDPLGHPLVAADKPPVPVVVPKMRQDANTGMRSDVKLMNPTPPAAAAKPAVAAPSPITPQASGGLVANPAGIQAVAPPTTPSPATPSDANATTPASIPPAQAVPPAQAPVVNTQPPVAPTGDAVYPPSQ